jgi:amino acid adenylation domain-containing protein
MNDLSKLNSLDVETVVRLTPMQEGMLFHYLQKPESRDYVEQVSLQLVGEMDTRLFEEAWGLVARQNPVLRTVFRWEKLEAPVQVVLKERRGGCSFVDFSSLPDEERMEGFRELLAEDRRGGLDLREVPFRVVWCRMASLRGYMLLTHHHILYDGWSSGILLREFFQFYSCLASGERPAPASKPDFSKYVEFIAACNTREASGFWSAYLEDSDRDSLPFPCRDKVNEATSVFSLELDGDFLQQLQACAQERRLTDAVFYYAAWSLLLHRYLDGDDVVFGTTVSGRDAAIDGIESMTGLFINTLPARVRILEGERTAIFLKRFQADLRERDRFFFSSLVEIKSYARLGGDTDLFDTLVVVENYPVDDLLSADSGSLRIQDMKEYGSTNYDLVLSVGAGCSGVCQFWYRENRMERDMVRRLASHFERLLREVVFFPESEAVELDMLGDDEKWQLLKQFNRAEAEFPHEHLFHELFQRQVERTPDSVAVVAEKRYLTYRQLDYRARLVAGCLSRHGCGRMSIVGVLVKRSPDMIAGVLGVLKIGGAYLPLDWDYPSRRIELMLQDSRVGTVITQDRDMVPANFGGYILDIGDSGVYHQCDAGFNGREPVPVSSPAYVIYTSGSTGTPKGVVIQHDQLMNMAYGWQQHYRLGEMDVRLLQMASFSFDVFAGDLARALMNAGCLIICPYDVKTDLHALYTLIIQERVTLLEATPPLVIPLMDWIAANSLEIRHLELLILGSDKCRMEDYKRLTALWGAHTRIVNSYGVTEAAVDSSYYEYTGGPWPSTPNVPIGKPFPNVKFYVVGKRGALQPLGIPGELLIGGASVGRGYLHNRELSDAVFLPDPFRPGGRLYKTGDLVRWLPDGNMEILGRTDQQVKIRGYRIEPGEVEQRILRRDDVRDCVVSAYQEADGDFQLCAYVVCDGPLDCAAIREDLALDLPPYMIPLFFVPIDEIPLSSNGKVDMRHLPAPGSGRRGEYVAPRDYVEKVLVSIWADVLMVDEGDIGIDDNFFRMGGHSLRVTVCAARIHKQLDVRLPLANIFNHATIRQLSGDIYRFAPEAFKPIHCVEKKDYYRLSAAQKRLYVLQQMNPHSTLYNISEIQVLHGEVDALRLEGALLQLSRRHESLRTSFGELGQEPVQRVREGMSFAIEHFDSRNGDAADGFIRPFDLSRGGLLRLGLVRNGEREFLLLLDMHHIISDGISEDILVKDLVALYNGETLSRLTLQYKDYSEWQLSAAATSTIRRQENYWLDRFAGDIPVLDLPADYERPSVQDFSGDRIVWDLPEDLSSRLKEIALRANATLNIVLLAAYKALLFRYTGQEDIVVGVPTAGRTHADLQDVIGMFVNMLPVRSFPRGEKTFAGFLAEVKDLLLEAFDNQDFQFDQLVEKLGLQRDPGRFPLFDVSFQVNHIDRRMGDEYQLDGTLDQLQISPFNYKSSQTKLDLVLEGIEIGDKITLIQEYSSSLFTRHTVEKLIHRYVAVLNQLASNIDIRLGEIVLPHDLGVAESDNQHEENSDFIFQQRMRF